jgi:hypothetical protein
MSFIDPEGLIMAIEIWLAFGACLYVLMEVGDRWGDRYVRLFPSGPKCRSAPTNDLRVPAFRRLFLGRIISSVSGPKGFTF